MLHVNDLVYRIGSRTLFDGATIMLPAKTRAGLVGRNGAGKTTLLRLIKGEITPESGSVSLQKGMRMAVVDQEAPGGPISILDTVLAADTERMALLTEAETATEPNRIAEIQTRLADIAAHSAEARAAEILAGLGFSGADQARPCSDFSGGWRMRVALAAALFADPDVLLLDEPTNYLDLEGAMWLETRVRNFRGSAFIISHDRDLLNAACNAIVHLREGKLFVYQGGYDQFERQLSEQQRLQMKLKARQEDERRRLQAFVDRFKAKASKAKQAQSRVKRLEKLQPVATIVENPVAPFTFPAPERQIAPPLIRLEGLAVGYDPSAPVLKGVDLRVDGDDRIGVLGRNGAGKTTLAKLLCGRLPPLAGHRRAHKKLEVAYFAQHQIDELNPKASAYDHVVERLPDATEAQRRARLGSFGLPQSRGDTPAGDLSGGEKARLLLHLITFDGPHVLILDEPTNHLDMDSRAALAHAINTYEGAVIIISHDRHLLEQCVDQLWLAADGAVAPYTDDIDAYRKLVTGRASAGAAEDAAKTSEKVKSRQHAAKARAEIAPLRKEAARWEREAERLREVLKVIDDGLATPGIFERKPDEAAALSKKRAKAVELIEAAEQKWLEAEEAYEAAKS